MKFSKVDPDEYPETPVDQPQPTTTELPIGTR